MKKNKIILYSGIAVILAATVAGHNITLEKDSKIDSKKDVIPVVQTEETRIKATAIQKNGETIYVAQEGYALDGTECKKQFKK